MKEITICKNRYLVTKSTQLGVMGETNAEVLKFIKPSDINGETIMAFTGELVFNYDNDSYIYPLIDEFPVPEELTGYNTINMFVRFKKNNEVKWKSYPLTFYLFNNGDESGTNPATIQKGLDLQTLNTVLNTEYETFETAIQAVQNLPENVKIELLAQLRASFTENIGGNYSDKTWEELIGNPPIEGFSNNGYNSGVLYNFRTGLSNLYKQFTEMILNSPQTMQGSLSGIESAINTVHSSVITALNAILDSDNQVDEQAPWTDILTAVDNLPSSVTSSINSAVNSASDDLRTDVDNLITALRTHYNLDFEYVTGNWQATLDSIGYLCEALNQPYEDLISGMEEILGITEVDSDE